MRIKDALFGKPAVEVTPLQQYTGSTQKWLPVSDIQYGMVVTKDGRFVKVLEVMPVNFYLKSPAEQQNIIFYFGSYLKIAPDNLQILSVTQKADIAGYCARMRERLAEEDNESCRDMMEDNIAEVEYLVDREAVTRRFFLVFQYEPRMKLRGQGLDGIAERLNEEAETARRYLDLCGLEVVQVEIGDAWLRELLMGLVNKKQFG